MLGKTDPIIIKDKVIKDATKCLGSRNIEFKVVKEVGHEVTIKRANNIIYVVGKALYI